MPESPERARQRKALARAEARRRQATTMLAIAQATCGYGVAQLGAGISPAEAHQTALFIAGELETVAAGLRRLTRPDAGERRALAVQLARRGELTARQIAAQVGVSERAVWGYLHAAGCAGNPGAGGRAAR